MAEKEFTVFAGQAICQKCKEDVMSLRLWASTGDVTWMCSKKHISKVALVPVKKKKKDFVDE
jgi:hypothetical protein